MINQPNMETKHGDLENDAPFQMIFRFDCIFEEQYTYTSVY